MSEATGLALKTIQEHSAKQDLVFVSDWSSPFAQRTWIALEQRGIPYTYKEASKSQKALDGSKYHPNQLLPYLELPNGRILRGSIPCIEYLEEAYSAGSVEGKTNGTSLWSNDLVDRCRERVWTDWIRRNIIPTFLRVMRAKQEDKHEASSIDLCRVLDVFAEEVRGPYFSGATPTLPDIVLAPFILRTRMKISNRTFRAPNHADAAASDKYQTYAKHLLEIESVKRTSPDVEETIDCPSPPIRLISSTAPKLPPELISLILSFTNDYELACTVGLPNALPRTAPWIEQSTRMDRAILSGQLSRVKAVYNASPAHRRFSKWGSRVMIRFGYIQLLDWLYNVEPAQMHEMCDELLPEVASAWGRVEVLEWAYRGSTFGIPNNVSPRAIDDASRNGHVEVLQWWLNSGIQPLSYSEDALNHATIKQQIPTLEWWKSSGLPLKIGNVMDFASMVKKPKDPSNPTELLDWWNSKSGLKGSYTKLALYHLSYIGNIPLLNWWRNSKLPLVYDKEVLIAATKQGKIESLEWWLNSRLPVSYTFFDIEEAIEDCVAGRDRVEKWWCKQGLRMYANAQNWTRSRNLGRF